MQHQHHVLLFLDSLGGGEVLLILVVVLLFFGSKKVPELARGLGRGVREFKEAMHGIKQDIAEGMKEIPEGKEIEKTSEK